MLVAHRKHRLLERAPLDLSKEGGQFLLCSQKIPSNLNRSRARRAADRPGMPAIPKRFALDSKSAATGPRKRIIRASTPGLWRGHPDR